MSIKNPWPNIKNNEFNDNTTLSSSLINSAFEFIKDQEVVKTVEGSSVEFKNCNTDPFVKVICYINPVQTGAGDPSPSNPRPITGFTGITINNGDITYPVSWQDEAGTVYGGYYDPLSGEVWATHGFLDLSNVTWTLVSNRARTSVISGLISAPPDVDTPAKAIAEKYTAIAYSASLNSNQTSFAVSSAGEVIFYYDGNTTPTGLFVYLLSTPVKIATIDPIVINSIDGINNVYHNGNGDISVKYKTTIRCLIDQ